jgi:hypothetical protein
MRVYLIILVLSFLFFSCSREPDECVEKPNSPIRIEMEWQQLQNLLPTIQSKQQLVDLLSNYPTLRDNFLHRSEYPNDSAFINTLYQRFTNPHFDSLLMETNRVFGDQSTLKNEFEEAFTNLQYYYPEIPLPKIQTVVTGLDNDLYISDTLIIVGLDYYLGKGAKYRPNMYEYLLRQYIPENIVPSIMLLYGIDTRINATNMQDKTVLADMVAYGKSYHFAKHMLPCKPDSIFMNYSKQEITESRKNQDLIWYRFVEDKVLYATNNQVKQRFLGERPKTIEVGPNCPGRIGQWMGWQIVNSYRKSHEDVTLQQLMQMSNADKLFKESKYKPTKK